MIVDWIIANWFELVAAVVTIVSIWLATKEHIGYYPTGVVALLLYTWTFFQAKLYAETFLQIVCLVLMIYGWYEWLHGGEQRTELAVSRTPGWAWTAAIISGIVGSAITIWTQLNYTDNPAPYVDSSLMAWSLVAQWMTARKWIENWILWLVINTISIPLYISRHLWITALLYAGLWVLAILGYVQWKRSMRDAGGTPTAASVPEAG